MQIFPLQRHCPSLLPGAPGRAVLPLNGPGAPGLPDRGAPLTGRDPFRADWGPLGSIGGPLAPKTLGPPGTGGPLKPGTHANFPVATPLP